MAEWQITQHLLRLSPAHAGACGALGGALQATQQSAVGDDVRLKLLGTEGIEKLEHVPGVKPRENKGGSRKHWKTECPASLVFCKIALQSHPSLPPVQKKTICSAAG